MPALRMSIARTVIVASLENPERPSSMETLVHGRRTMSETMTTMAVTSTGTGSWTWWMRI